MGALQWHSLLVEFTDQIVWWRAGCSCLDVTSGFDANPPTSMRIYGETDLFAGVLAHLWSVGWGRHKETWTDVGKQTDRNQDKHSKQINRTKGESKSLDKPGMLAHENCQCELNKSHGKTGATTRLRQTMCVPKPYELMANKAPVTGSLRVRQL